MDTRTRESSGVDRQIFPRPAFEKPKFKHVAFKMLCLSMTMFVVTGVMLNNEIEVTVICGTLTCRVIDMEGSKQMMSEEDHPSVRNYTWNGTHMRRPPTTG